MQRGLSDISNQIQPDNTSQSSKPLRQHGFQHHDSSSEAYSSLLQQSSGGGVSPRSARGVAGEGVYPDSLEERLRRLNVARGEPNATRSAAPGQRISEYENALTPAIPKQPLGFKVIKRADAGSDGVQLLDFPNEILTHILSHLHPDSHASVALVSKRFYSLITTPHAWRMAFQRFFPGQDALVTAAKPHGRVWPQDDSDFVRSEVRHFTRLTLHASWRSEYFLRTRLLRSLVRGKPGSSAGGIGSSARTSQSSKKASAVLTYNTKVPTPITHIHATFNTGGKKAPMVVHGASEMGIASASDPTCGKVEKWGLDEMSFAQLDEVVPFLLPYGVGEGPAAVPNVMDVSQPYGLVAGEGFPGGRVFYRSSSEYRGKYLGQETGLIEAHPDIPKIPELSESICAVWIAKSSTVPSMTQSLVGIMTGSSLGVVTSYALGYDSNSPRYSAGEMSARWVLCPGVPIVALKVDDSYSQKRKALGRVWAVALNALGEIYYLTQPPTAPTSKTKADDTVKLAWHTGRTTSWHLVEASRRQARMDESGKNAVRGAYSPKSPSNSMGLTKDQMAAEAREIERFLRYKPAHFRKVCYGWDMRRKLEVDFANDDGNGAGESVFIFDCALEEDQTSSIKRFQRITMGRSQSNTQSIPSPDTAAEIAPVSSMFGGGSARSPSPNSPSSPLPKHVLSASGKSSPPSMADTGKSDLDGWSETCFCSKELSNSQITASGIDASQLALVTSFEDPLKDAPGFSSSSPSIPTRQAPSDIPGRRARLFGVGTNKGKVILWNAREVHTGDGVHPVRIIQTESPEVSSLALSALYLVHGGSDGLAQAWDPLASTLEPLRTINSRSSGRMPRHVLLTNPAAHTANFSAVGAIYLDPDPTALHGIVAFGTFVRYWAYSSSNHATGRKRRHRHSDIHGRVTGRRHGGGVEGYIAAEAEELRNEQEHNAREQARLRSRFGVGLGDLTEEEALRYAEMVSQESFLLDEQRRISASDTGSAADFETTSSSGSTVTPDPSVTGPSPLAASSSANNDAADESDYERQIQAAIRLSLMEDVNDMGSSPRASSSGEYGAQITIKDKRNKKSSSSSSPPSSHIPVVKQAESSSLAVTSPHSIADDDLEFALQLSLAEEESRKASLAALENVNEEFPTLGGTGLGKGKGKAI
ncbi:uncharacterized protein F4812DRAFT_418452 [Daldinia caldariorum]|uniref:uncharacterized protein n=1 Tax=Daldinia caldariorum TaxID=326644 RepID=UPI0020082932|nr:uncharacterized protein F4812DRAFT_418452 [Daldinia caldariorum]KAI1470641.1 hypothetical protein F4812DRAFT_418452 [Daldinia caldariorum]